jgi:hypothetical protein
MEEEEEMAINVPGNISLRFLGEHILGLRKITQTP